MNLMRIACILLVVLTVTAYAQDDKRDLKNFVDTGVDIVKRPLHFTATDWGRLGGIAAITAASSFLDDDIQQFTRVNQYPALDAIFSIDEFYLESLAGLAAGFYIYGLASDKPKTRRLGLNLLESTVYSLSVTQGLKVVFGRTRPSATTDPAIIEPFQIAWEKTSFPSGHATFAFSFARVMAEEDESVLWKTAWYTFAVVGSLARVYNNHHWLSDVVLGGFIGYFIGDFVVKRNHPSKFTEALPPPPLFNVMVAL